MADNKLKELVRAMVDARDAYHAQQARNIYGLTRQAHIDAATELERARRAYDKATRDLEGYEHEH